MVAVPTSRAGEGARTSAGTARHARHARYGTHLEALVHGCYWPCTVLAVCARRPVRGLGHMPPDPLNRGPALPTACRIPPPSQWHGGGPASSCFRNTSPPTPLPFPPLLTHTWRSEMNYPPPTPTPTPGARGWRCRTAPPPCPAAAAAAPPERAHRCSLGRQAWRKRQRDGSGGR